MRLRRLAAVLACAVGLAAYGVAASPVGRADDLGVALRSAGWFLSPARRGLKNLDMRGAGFVPVESVSLSKMRAPGRVRPKIEIVNQSATAAEGILIRYDFALKIAPAASPRNAEWALPFMSDEYRIPRLGPGASRSALLDPEVLRQTLARVSAAGFIADALRFEAMLEPRPQDERPLQKISGVIRLEP